MPKTTNLTVSDAEISLRAYQIWEAEGKPNGKDFEHWLKAKAELSPAANRPTAHTIKPARRKPAAKKF